MTATDENTYHAVFQAIAGLQTAIKTYTDARYLNYRQRLVSPRAAYDYAVSDVAEIVTQLMDSDRLRLQSEHADEIIEGRIP